jgi:hypothetical protein
MLRSPRKPRGARLPRVGKGGCGGGARRGGADGGRQFDLLRPIPPDT